MENKNKITFNDFMSRRNKRDIINLSPKTVQLDGIEIYVKQYLPLEEKAELLGGIILNSFNREDNQFDFVLMEMLYSLSLIHYYTNINILDEKETPLVKIYDYLEQNNLFSLIFKSIPPSEINIINNFVKWSYDSQTNYLNSLRSFISDSTNYKESSEEISKNLKDALKSYDEMITKQII